MVPNYLLWFKPLKTIMEKSLTNWHRIRHPKTSVLRAVYQGILEILEVFFTVWKRASRLQRTQLG
jgi:hypothetical protein